MFYILLQILVIVTVATSDLLPPTLLLNDGNRIPVLSFGTFGRVHDLGLIKPAVIKAIESGYRQIDTASAYLNEELIGEAIADVISRGIVTREELYITTKVASTIGTREGVLSAIQESLQRLKLDYVDLYLIHWPVNLMNVSSHDFLDVWKGMEDTKKLNLSQSIGVSNFEISDLERLLANSETVPSVNQIEVHPIFADTDLVTFCQSKNITVLSYAPFGFMVQRPWIISPPISTFEEPILRQLARKYGKMPSQIILRYLIDRGTIPIPRSTNMKHIEINIDVFDFQLTAEEINSINKLNKGDKVYSFDLESLLAFMEYYGLL